MALDVAAVADDDAWAVGVSRRTVSYYEPLVARWVGSGWTFVPMNPWHGTLSAVEAVAADDVWMAGDQVDTAVHPIIVHWDGQSLAVVPGPAATGSLLDLSASGPTDVWAVGHSIVEHWDGLTWSMVDAPIDATSVLAIAPDDVWIAGGASAHWNGSTWMTFPFPQQGLGLALAATPRAVWSVGYLDHFDGTVDPVSARWNGSAWKSVPIPVSASNARLEDVAFTGHMLWAVGEQAGPSGLPHAFSMRWSLEGWKIESTPSGGLSIGGLRGVDGSPGVGVWSVGRTTTASGEKVLALHRCPA